MNVLGSYYFVFNFRDPRFGGEENLLLRQAISMAINRETINEAVYNGTRTLSTGVTPPGISGFLENICEYCAYDPEGAAAAFEEWQAAGNSIDEPLPVMFNAGSVHELVTDIIVENLAAIGIPRRTRPAGQRDVLQRARRRRVRLLPGWLDRRLPDVRQLHCSTSSARKSLDGNNYGYSNPEFDALVAEARRRPTRTPATTCSTRPRSCCSTPTSMVVPINWYLGDYAFNPDTLAELRPRSDVPHPVGADHRHQVTDAVIVMAAVGIPVPTAAVYCGWDFVCSAS